MLNLIHVLARPWAGSLDLLSFLEESSFYVAFIHSVSGVVKICAGSPQCGKHHLQADLHTENKFFVEMFMLMWSLFALEIILEILDTAGEASGVCVNAKTTF